MKHCKRIMMKAETGDDGTTTVTASTPDVDRMNDVVAPSWDLSHYKNCPVVIWAHDYSTPPVGRAVSVELDGTTLVAAIKWDDNEANPLGKTVAHQFREGFLSAVSVGFSPGDSVQRSTLDGDHPSHGDSGLVYGMNTPNQLLEISAVPIPANPHATAMRAAPAPVDVRDELLRLLATDDAIRAEVGSLAADWKPEGTDAPQSFFELLTN